LVEIDDLNELRKVDPSKFTQIDLKELDKLSELAE